jgi:hypothetical protein
MLGFPAVGRPDKAEIKSRKTKVTHKFLQFLDSFLEYDKKYGNFALKT